MSGTHKDLLFWSKSRYFACKNHTWWLGPIETRNSVANHAVLPAQNDRCGLGTIETCNSGPKHAIFSCKKQKCGLEQIETSNSDANHAVLHAQNHRRGLGHTGTCNFAPKSLFWMNKATDEGRVLQRLVILVLITLFCMHKTTGEAWDP